MVKYVCQTKNTTHHIGDFPNEFRKHSPDFGQRFCVVIVRLPPGIRRAAQLVQCLVQLRVLLRQIGDAFAHVLQKTLNSVHQCGAAIIAAR